MPISPDRWREASSALLAEHAEAIRWRDALPKPYTMLWLPEALRERTAGENTLLQIAHEAVFSDKLLSPHLAALPENGVRWRRTPLGQPYALWTPEMETWATPHDLKAEHFHLSNTHDGEMTLLLALYSERVIGVGIDLVDLERLRPKSRDYLFRFARRFMSEEEYRSFSIVAERDSDADLLVRVASHFSLMEAASKALGTGLKIGMGMGTAHSLPMQSLLVKQLAPSVRLGFVGEAMRRLKTLGTTGIEAFVGNDSRYLVSAVVLFRSSS